MSDCGYKTFNMSTRCRDGTPRSQGEISWKSLAILKKESRRDRVGIRRTGGEGKTRAGRC
jgi:hypothetical protein